MEVKVNVPGKVNVQVKVNVKGESKGACKVKVNVRYR